MTENFTHISYHDDLEKRIKLGHVSPENLIEILREAEKFGLTEYDNARHIAKVFKMIVPYDDFIGNVSLVDCLFDLLYTVYIGQYFNAMSKDIYYAYCAKARLSERTIRRIFSMTDFRNQRVFNKMVGNDNIPKDVLLNVVIALFEQINDIENYLSWMLIFYRKTTDQLIKERARKYFYDLIPDEEFLPSTVKDMFLF